MELRNFGLAAGLILAVVAGAACRSAEAEPARRAMRAVDIVLARDSEIIHKLIPANTTLASLLAEHRVAGAEGIALVQHVAAAFDPRRFRAGQPYRLDRFFDGRIREFEYEIDGDRRLLARRLDDSRPEFAAEVVAIPKQRSLIAIEGKIDRDAPSLIEALSRAVTDVPQFLGSSVPGFPERRNPGTPESRNIGTPDVDDRIGLSLALADVFSGEVDFNSDLQPGDSFRLLVENAVRDDGLFGGYGPVLAAELANEGRMLRAFRFTLPDGKPGYYDEQGRSLKRFLLKSPLKFDPRITSAFSRSRRHPILGYSRAHNGVDYAAAPGAPVAAVAGGTVTLAGWTGGGGRTVKIRHASGYESEYLHLSAIATGIRPGVRVGQGELVGLVGSTGLATGPHLHYGLRRNGSYVNPVREHLNMPPGDPVPAALLVVFGGERDRLFGQLLSERPVLSERPANAELQVR